MFVGNILKNNEFFLCNRLLTNFILFFCFKVQFGIASSFIQYDPFKKPNADEKVYLEPQDVKNLSFDYMIKQSAIEAANSASTALTVTYTAIEATSKEYRYIANYRFV